MITKINVENFRSIKHVSIALAETNVLIGANGAGKSTLIEALNFIKGIVQGNTISKVARFYAPWGQDFFNVFSDDYISKFSIEIQTKDNHKFVYSFSIGYSPIDSANEEFYVYSEKLDQVFNGGSSKVIFSRAPNSNKISVEKTPTNESGELPIKIETNRLVLATISHPDVKKVVETIAAYEVIWFDEKFGRRSEPKLIVDDPSSLETIDDIAVSLFKKDTNRFVEACNTIKKIIPEFQQPIIIDISENFINFTQSTSADATESPEKASSRKDQKSSRYYVNWGDIRHQNTFARFAISGGNLRVIYLILSLYNTENKSCFIAEEIENGMHPGRVRKVVQIILQIAKQRQIQLIFSTHNYSLTSEVLPRDVIFCEYVDNEGSRYERLTDTESYKLVEEALNAAPSTEDILNSGLLFGS